MQAWKDRLEQYGMRLNVKKTEYVECGEQTPGTIFVDDAELPKASAFKYLGSRISADGSTLVEAEYRANAAWSKWRQVTGVMCDRKVPLKLKSKIYRTVVRPVALYGAECWPTTLKHEQTLHTMEMRMLRWTQGLTRLDRVRNDDVRAMFGVAPIVAKMREARLRWYGHVLRSDDNSVAKSAMNIIVEGAERVYSKCFSVYLCRRCHLSLPPSIVYSDQVVTLHSNVFCWFIMYLTQQALLRTL
ncbi:hypothetical protein ANCCEY_07976 [Ancylostoma ceylanicum]|uniref:Reverse transcriptase domain-containing protein n=1 Tax=Ancylostoma ceylanicum TaxID=53326 RepID=A0A0D6LM76_9BILA|nr:hypothetical protein ANCCEY_07976 [Ancylostoma ceylanicum]